MYSKQPATNFGSETTLRVNGASAKKESSYLRFDVQGLNAPVTGAVLRVFAQTSNSGLSLQGVADNSWNENTITYANAPPFGSPVGDSASASGGQWVSLNATSLVQGNGTLSMAITTTFNGERFLSSREIAAQAPQLVVQTRPRAISRSPPPATSPAIRPIPTTTVDWGPPRCAGSSTRRTCS